MYSMFSIHIIQSPIKNALNKRYQGLKIPIILGNTAINI